MLKAVIFDLNGTVLADEKIYGAAFRRVLAFLGKRVDKSYPQIAGIGVEENWPRLLSKYHINTKRSVEDLARMTQEGYLKNIGYVRIRSGFKELASELRRKDILVALATSNSWWLFDKVSEKLGLAKYFDVVTTKEEVAFNKPSPDIFLVTAEKLGVKPESCVVIEDSASGLEAAKAAGMKAVALVNSKGDRKLLEKDADLVIRNFRVIKIERLNLL